MPFVLATVEWALRVAQPEIWNSDQGNHFTSPQYIDRLKAAQVQIRMDGRDRALDNIFNERLWRSLKYEEVYLKDYTSPRQARRSIADYLTFFNTERLHKSRDYQTPTEVYLQTQAVLAGDG